MSPLKYSITIDAPRQRVWEKMLNQSTYEEWTSAFHEGSTFEGSWEKGSKIRFVAKGDETQSGMYGRIAENIPQEYVSIEQLGEIVNGEEDTDSEWAGTYENYRFSDVDGKTLLEVELIGEGVSQEMGEMFNQMWPDALQRLKEICEKTE